MIPISRPIIGKEEKEAVMNVLESGNLAQGKIVKEFEENFARYIGTKHAIATSNGTTALQLALLAHGIGKDDEVIVPAFSFIATANAVIMAGATPVFVDISDDFNIDADKIEEKITNNTKAMIPVHLYGQPCDMKRLVEICERHDLILIEDACQAHGAEYFGRKVGSFGAGCFSFYPTKNMTTGEGGMVTTNDSKIAEKVSMLRDHGSRKRYCHEFLGYNYRMTEIAAAIGIEQLKKLDMFNKKRIENATRLLENLSSINEIVLPKLFEDRKHVFHQFTVRTKRRDELAKHLASNDISYGIYYPLPMYRQKHFNFSINLPNTESACNEVISLPVYPSITEEDIKHMCAVLKTFSK